MSQIILIPTDFSRVCSNALNHGAELARNIDAKLVVLHVINEDSLSFLKKNSYTEAYIEQQLEETKKELEGFYKINVITIKKSGKLIPNIVKTAEELKVDLVVFGTHGKTGIQKITGSHAMKLIYALSIPVLVVQKRTFGMGYRKIVFPINISTDYDVKIDWSIFIAKAFQATISIFTMKTEDDQIRKALDELTLKIQSTFDAHQIPHTLEKAGKNSNFPDQINEFAAAESADLIMIKVDNDEFEPSFILGALEEKMIFNSSQIPVFCAQKKD
jgi:nucleotide-binding universal stress UspA family protein